MAGRVGKATPPLASGFGLVGLVGLGLGLGLFPLNPSPESETSQSLALRPAARRCCRQRPKMG
jgi:hypothetical protein